MSGLSPTALTALLALLAASTLALGVAVFHLRGLLRTARATPALPVAPPGPALEPATTSTRLAEVALDAILATSFDPVILTNADGRIERVNGAAASWLGMPPASIAGRLFLEAFQLEPHDMPFPRFSAAFEELRRRGKPSLLEGHCRFQPAGAAEPLVVEVAGSPLFDGAAAGGLRGFALVLRDVSAKRRSEAEQGRAERLESLALLAGGIAHDFNNLLTILLGNLSLLRAEEHVPRDFEAPLADAEKAVLRARGLADQLLTFSSGSTLTTRAHSLADLLRDSASFVFRGAKVRCTLDIADDLRPVEIDPQQIHQVLNNLLINAGQAMPEGGVVEVRAENVRVGIGQSKLRPGSYVKVAIRDHGPGIETHVLSKIFDPYFTTKPDGTGLGLSTSISIVKRHRGAIEVESQPGEGSTFSLMLPTARGQAETQTIAVPRGLRGRGKVLVMDDEQSIVNILSAALKRLGFEPVATADGKAALEARAQAAAAGQPFDLAILDLTIPGGMGGVETAAALRKEQPNLLLVASSGYAQNPIFLNFRDHGFDQILVKPYRIQELAQLMSALLPADGETKT
jgi:PAS domain S-box-containing protein